MATQIKTIGVNGIEGYIIDVQVKLINGLSVMNIVGLGDAAVKEARDRIESAFEHLNFKFPKKKIVINLSPSDIKKSGTSFDLPMLIGLLIESAVLNDVGIKIKEFIFIGEIGLTGELQHTRGILPMLIHAKNIGIKNIVLPLKSLEEAKLVKGLNLYAFTQIEDVVNWLEKRQYHRPIVSVEAHHLKIQNTLDFKDVKGQDIILEFVAIAAAGNHNMLLIGPPGCGKSMIAKRMQTILPPMTEQEKLESMAIHSVSGALDKANVIGQRPFRAPHYNASTSAIIGGGATALPGEISLAHNGVLFLDEFPEFARQTLEALRQPLEDQKVTISRVKQSNTYPAHFILIAAMNPCPCGYYGHTSCSCTPYEIKKYRNRISGPIFDRIDIQKFLSPIDMWEAKSMSNTITSENLATKVARARELQTKRFKEHSIHTNSQMEPYHIDKYCQLNSESDQLIKAAFERYAFSARVYNSILKVARTCADLRNSKSIEKEDVILALMARDLDKAKS
ncbi:YifB family Mg chelatase-like AAA ATPase [Fusibacter bizertensis]